MAAHRKPDTPERVKKRKASRQRKRKLAAASTQQKCCTPLTAYSASGRRKGFPQFRPDDQEDW